MKCSLIEHLTNRLIEATRRQEHHEIIRLTRECNEHNDKCMVCSGAAVSLVDQWFGMHVQVIGE